jgi:hypothetical protein
MDAASFEQQPPPPQSVELLHRVVLLANGIPVPSLPLMVE